jgi:benzoate/toluate 1,2-dioxygenase beta subunit
MLRISSTQQADDLTDSSPVREFLFREGRLVDEGQYAEWLRLWTEDALYRVPCNHDDIDPRSHVSIIYDDRERLGQRITGLLSGSVLAVQPKPRMRRVISNIQIISNDDRGIAVEANFNLGETKPDGTRTS